MTTGQRLERDLPMILDELAMSPYPDYIDIVLTVTARKRQRPRWTFFERWLPMTAVSSRAALIPRTPLRIAGLVALLLIVLAMGAVLIVGSQRPLPAPFGPAANGHVAYAANGDIYTADPASGIAHAVITGPDTDLAPVWSRDGTHLAFERKAAGTGDLGRLYAARSDGRELVAVTPDPLHGLGSYSFSPNGRAIVFAAGPTQARDLWIANVDGSGVRRLEVGMPAFEPSYLPPNGAEIIFASDVPADVANGLYAVNVDTGIVRSIVAPAAGSGLDWVRASPDGSRIAYSAGSFGSVANNYQIQVVTQDGARNVTLPMPAGATWEDAPFWSNDSTRLVVTRGYAAHNDDVVLAAVPADGRGVGVETAHGLTGCCDTTSEWAPDDRSILTTPEDMNGAPIQQLLWDPSTGATRPAPWPATSVPTWQRIAP
ncbi:MAG: LpqB family beta-propeller domain-containing protein [Chloroflexota bacterium]